MAGLRRASLVLFLSVLISSVCADYYIDDTNTTLTYASGPKAAWGPFAAGASTLELLLPNGTYQIIDPFVCYNHTYRYAACFSTDSCILTMPFTGSGITVYVYQAGPVGINASITVDGAHAQTNVLNAPPAPNYEIANVSMFSVQQLQTGSHTLSMLVNDLFGSYSGMMFDYALVNETLVTNPVTTTSASSLATTSAASTSSPASSSPASSSSAGSKTNIGAIVGGVIGGIAAIALGILAFWWMRRRKQASEMVDLHDGPIAPYNPHAAYDPPHNQLISTPGLEPFNPYTDSTTTTVRSDLPTTRSMEFAALVPNRLGSTHDLASMTPRSPSATARDVVTPFTATSSDRSTGDRKTQLVLSNDTSNASTQPFTQTSHSPQSSRQDMSPLLTDEQADFINSLHQNNVPAAAIARVMERMLADRHAGIREWERETRLARSNTMTTAPPSYDQVGRRD